MSTTPPFSLPTSRRPNAESGADYRRVTPAWQYRVVLADGLLGVNRLVTMLRQRTHDVISMHAAIHTAVSGGPTGSVTIVVASTERDAALLDHRLLRVPTVLEIQRSRADMPAGSA